MKGVQFANYRRVGNPARLARIYEAQGAHELLVTQIHSDIRGLMKVVDELAGELSIPLVAGGGIRSAHEALEVIRAGADGVTLGEPTVQLCEEVAEKIGVQAITASVDYKGCVTSKGRGLETYVRELRGRVGEILLTNIEREGTGLGLDLKILAWIRPLVGCPLLLGGGASGRYDIQEAFRFADGVVIGRLLAFTNQSYPQLLAGLSTTCQEPSPEPPERPAGRGGTLPPEDPRDQEEAE